VQETESEEPPKEAKKPPQKEGSRPAKTETHDSSKGHVAEHAIENKNAFALLMEDEEA